jgi:hypothetical protein
MVSHQVFRFVVEQLKAEGAEIVTALDDTLNTHIGRDIFGAGWQHDGSAHPLADKKGYGVCFVIIGVVVRLPEINSRAFCLPYAARVWIPRKTKNKPQGAPHKEKTQLGLDLINLTFSWLEGGERLRVVADMAYCCERILKGRPKAVHITGKMKKTSALYGLVEPPTTPRRGRPRVYGVRYPSPEVMFEDSSLEWETLKAHCYRKEKPLLVHRFTALWHSAGENPLAIVLCRDPSRRYRDTVFFDTDPNASAAEIIGRYATRWSIEVTIRETKQLLGAADPQCRCENSVTRTPMFAYWAYSLVVVWFATQFSFAKNFVAAPPPWYRRKRHFTFSDMLAAARRSDFKVGISREARTPNEKPKISQTRYTRELKHTECAKL